MIWLALLNNDELHAQLKKLCEDHGYNWVLSTLANIYWERGLELEVQCQELDMLRFKEVSRGLSNLTTWTGGKKG